ncbi:uncharacterized protein LOC129253297 [Anastrepha obliqua]|uniref:uncharacterized protein LOC129253297 n=1 Tax=Anastrepha obliqua TaxID=95512 RepID=UPI00240A4B9F|nr:uncharacterized protein LOC129253297 [Anastrepha obliqua]
MKQILILAASALLLVQLVHALPHTKRESVAVAVHENHVSKDASYEEVDPKLKLFFFTLARMTVVAQWTLDKGSEVLKNAVKELNEIPDKDELLQANIIRMSRIANEISQKEDGRQGIKKRAQYTADFFKLLDDFEKIPDDSKLKITIKTALENNGFTKFVSEVKEKYLAFAKNFEHVFGEFLKEMTPAEKSKNSKLVQWFEEFKAETNMMKKFDKFNDFFDLI